VGHHITFLPGETHGEFVLNVTPRSAHNSTGRVGVKLHYGAISGSRIDIKNEQAIEMQEVGPGKLLNYGPLRVRTLANPTSYLKRLYGANVFRELVHEGLTVGMPKMVYDCYYNQWSSYTSDHWKTRLVAHLARVFACLMKHKVRCWIDCGTLLGAARNSFVCLFDDDADIGILAADRHRADKALETEGVGMQVPIRYVNGDFSLKRHYNPNTSYNGKENLNYAFSENLDLIVEFREYELSGGQYVSTKDATVSRMHRVPGLARRRATARRHFDNVTGQIKLGRFLFHRPHDHRTYLESDSRYGKGSIEGRPIRDCKPGNVVLYDDFLGSTTR
jgi:hypothetical protein